MFFRGGLFCHFIGTGGPICQKFASDGLAGEKGVVVDGASGLGRGDRGKEERLSVLFGGHEAVFVVFLSVIGSLYVRDMYRILFYHQLQNSLTLYIVYMFTSK
jgi:hypothetical protein